MTEDPIVLTGFGLSFGEQVVLANVDMRIRSRGAHLLMGPVGVGKSALLRTLCGLNAAQPGMRTWGLCAGQSSRLSLVAQDARFLVSSVRENLCAALPDRGDLTPAQQLERIRSALDSARLSSLREQLEQEVIDLPLHVQRRLAVVRALLTEPDVLCLDEPTSNLDDAQADALVELVRDCSERMAVLMVTHNQKVARALGGEITLLAGGRVQEQGPTCDVLDAPQSEAGRSFVKSGSCALPGPGTPANLLRTDAPPPPRLPSDARASIGRAMGPRHFYWLLKDQLGGLPRPGVVRELDADVKGLVELGIRVLYTLEEKRTVPEDSLHRVGIESRWLPIVDMGVPSLPAMAALCAELERSIEQGYPCAVHCLAGLGRTGTVLACFLIARGQPSHQALERVRALRPWAVQSQQQHRFLLSFERFVRSAA